MPIKTPRELATARRTVAKLATRRFRLIADQDGPELWRDLNALDADLATALETLGTDPCDGSPDVPLVLLPVRVVTKLDGNGALRVRITPDEVHVDSLVRSTSEKEIAAGKAYWNVVWQDTASPTAWPELVQGVGDRRAAWVAQATTPTNLAARGSHDPEFPPSPDEVTRGTVARCLPDRFVVRVFPETGDPLTVVGSPVPRDLGLSPIAFGSEEMTSVGDVVVPARSQWTMSFEHAVSVGLGVVVPLPPGTTRIDRVVVVGTRNSVSEADNAAELADLLESHRFSDGFSLLPVGTPTNNSDDERSPYQGSATIPAPPVDRAAPSPDATSVASILGLDPGAVEALLDAVAPRTVLEGAQAAANTSLWFATWQPVLQRLDDVDVLGVSPATIEAARQVHRDDVRGAGHSPAIRIGAQPYGILPVTDLAAWRPRSGDLTAGIAPLVQRTLSRWDAQARVVPRVRTGEESDMVSDQDLLDIMGTSPYSTGVRARPLVDGAGLEVFASATGASPEMTNAEIKLRRALLAQYSVDAAQRITPPSLHQDSRTIALPLVSDRDPGVISEILAGGAPKVDSLLQALLDVAWDEAGRRLFRTAPAEYVSPLVGLLNFDERIKRFVAEAVAGTLDAQSDELFAAAAEVRSVKHFDAQPTEQLSISAIEPVAEARTSLARVALELGDTAEAKWIGQNAISGLLEAFGHRVEVRQAMTVLGSVPLPDRRIAVAQALDTASHRVDAWATAIAHARRRRLAEENPTGMTLGAYGYVEDVQLGTGLQESQGWLHAPSSTHAVAAGILASAHRSRIGAKPGTSPFALDLSSRRLPEVRRLLEGLNAGQSLGALLGYQIERGLTGSAARFQLSLRELAPLNIDDLDNDLDADTHSARAAAAAVVDGVALLRQFPVDSLGGNAPPLRTRLDAKPRNAYVEEWEAVEDKEWKVVAAALRTAASTVDALSDTLMAESVLQHASGSAARASAAMDSLSSGSSVDPDLGILEVRQPGHILTHGLLALVPTDAPGWSTTRPRAQAEPYLEAWAARRLGRPEDAIIAEIGGRQLTLADAGIAALDLVFTDDGVSLDQDLRRLLPELEDTPLAAVRDAAWPAAAQPVLAIATLAGTLRSMVAGAAPVLPHHLVSNGAPSQRTIDTVELLTRCERLLASLGGVVEAGRETIESIDAATFAVEDGAVAGITDAVAELGAYGIPLSPDPTMRGNVAWAWSAWTNAASRLHSSQAVLEAIRSEPDPSVAQVLDAATTIAEAVFEDGFRMLPVLTPGADDDLSEALQHPLFPVPQVSRISAFVRSHATVKPSTAKLAEAQLIGGALGRDTLLRVVQLTERANGTAARGTDRWLAGPLSDDVPWPDNPATHLVLDIVAPDGELSGAMAGFLIDAWTESLPFQPDPGAFDPAAPENPLRAARATTALAIRAQQASARAPQTILSVISPDEKRWATDSVVQAVLGAIEVARARLVTLEHVPGDASILPAIQIASPWLQPRKGLSFHQLAQIPWAHAAMPFLSELE